MFYYCTTHLSAHLTHLGLITRYGKYYSDIPYIIKLDGKTNLSQSEPYSQQLWTVEQVLTFTWKQYTHICGVGYTIYLGSEYERNMLVEATTIIQRST